MKDIFHLWDCDALKRQRREADEDLAAYDLSALPKHLLLGVPNHRLVDLTGNLSPINYQGPGARWGMDCLLDTRVAISDEVKAAFQAIGANKEHLNTQEMAYKFLKCLGPLQGPRITTCNGTPPEEPNVFSDGSYLHPGDCLAHASFGSWETGRAIEDIVEEETDFCRPVFLLGKGKASGIIMAGTIPGVFSSSTRAELAGVITSLAKPVPLYIALDNLSVVHGIQAIIDGVRHRRPWALLPDGDLWAIAEQAIMHRGANSVAVTWTKAHATWEHLLLGITSHRAAIGNGIADAAADCGHEAVGRNEEQLVLNYIAETQKAYAQLVTRLQRYALAIMEADKNERKLHNFTNSGKSASVIWLEIPSQPTCRPAFTEGQSLIFLELPRAWKRHSLRQASSGR